MKTIPFSFSFGRTNGRTIYAVNMECGRPEDIPKWIRWMATEIERNALFQSVIAMEFAKEGTE